MGQPHTVATVRRPTDIDRPGAVDIVIVATHRLHSGAVQFHADRVENGELRTYFGRSPGVVLNAMRAARPHVEHIGMEHQGGRVERHLWCK